LSDVGGIYLKVDLLESSATDMDTRKSAGEFNFIDL